MCPVTVVLVRITEGQTGVRPTDETAFRGEQVVFNCSGSEIRWTLGSKKIFSSGLSDPWDTPKGNKYDIIGNYYLIVKDLEASSDSGRYICDTDEDRVNLIEADLVVIGNIFKNFCVRCNAVK